MTTPAVLFEEKTARDGYIVAFARLNMPRSINALTQDMVNLLSSQLERWRQRPEIVCVVLDGAGERGFCAGGDVVSIRRAVLSGETGEVDTVERFYTSEYRLDEMIHTFDRPLLCWGDGAVMGGGLGLMAGASHRVVTDTSRLAMPEVRIGFFPDVGASWFLNRMPAGIGRVLGVTGATVAARDARLLGLADHHVPAGGRSEVYEALLAPGWGDDVRKNQEHVTALLQRFSDNAPPSRETSAILRHWKPLSRAGACTDVHGIFETLRSAGGDWPAAAADSLAHGSPSAARLAFDQLTRTRHHSLREAFASEAALAPTVARSHDFLEGVRALLVDKDRSPAWRPLD